MQIDNITIRDYYTLVDKQEYDTYFNILKPVNLLCGKRCNTNSFTFDEVETYRKIYNNPTYDNIKDMFVHVFRIRGDLKDSADSEFLNESVFTFFRANTFLQNFLVSLAKREGKLLAGEKDVKMEMIGAYEILAPVNHLLTKIELAEQFGTTPTAIGKWKYNEVLNILIAKSRRNLVNKEYNKIK